MASYFSDKKEKKLKQIIIFPGLVNAADGAVHNLRKLTAQNRWDLLSEINLVSGNSFHSNQRVYFAVFPLADKSVHDQRRPSTSRRKWHSG
jgi:hypothetical protein